MSVTPSESKAIKALKREHQLNVDNFEYYAEHSLKITTKEGYTKALVLNEAQRIIHNKLEEQLQETGKVRALILKGRQQGASTYVEARLMWKTANHKGKNTFILTHKSDATQAIWKMTKRYYDNLPAIVKPSISASNSSELIFNTLDSGYRVSTAGGTAVGRGLTLQYVHGSEVAYWPNSDQQVGGLLQTVADVNDTEIILESTPNGATGLFYKMCMDAYKGESEYQLVFIPWFLTKEYKINSPIDKRFELSTEEQEFKDAHLLSNAQIYWRRNKIKAFPNGVVDFRREYPATVEEAFMAETLGALWMRPEITRISASEYELIKDECVETVIAFDPAGSSNINSDESGLVLANLHSDGLVYITKDLSGTYPPSEVIDIIITNYHKYSANRVTVETNYGGEWVTNSIHQEDQTIPIYKVHAKKGKKARAQPVAHAYRLGKVVHVGQHNKLEDEMCCWDSSDPTAESPNRIDALVYAVTDLLNLGTQQPQPVYCSIV